MPAMTVDGTTTALAEVTKRNAVVSIASRAWDDTLVTTRPTTAATVPEWQCVTGKLSDTEADTLVTALTSAGTVTMAGDEFGSGVVCQAFDIGWVTLQDVDRKRVTFTVRQVTP